MPSAAAQSTDPQELGRFPSPTSFNGKEKPTMPSKLSIHIRDYPSNIWDAVGRMQPRVIKVFNHTSDMNIDTLKRVAHPLVIFRQFTNLNDFQSHTADEFVAELTRDGGALSKLAGRGILWEGINEPGIGQDGSPADRARAEALNTWYLRFAELMHARGEKVAGFSWSTGNPTDKQLQWIIPLITPAAAAVDAHALHEYAKPRSQTPPATGAATACSNRPYPHMRANRS